MKARDILFIILGGIVGLIGFGILKSLLSSQPERAPTIAGQEVPKENFIIDFSRRYNLILNDYKDSKTYENVKILGYTGKTVRESSGKFSSSYGHFGRWLTIELPDRRRVYFSDSSISFIEEVEPPTTP